MNEGGRLRSASRARERPPPVYEATGNAVEAERWRKLAQRKAAEKGAKK
jgi:hypothetical protein